MTVRRFPEVPGGYPFPRLEQETLARWQADGLFRRTLEKTQGGQPFVFFEGPPTANNVPHVGHVLTRVVKDLFPRFRTMQGFHVERKAGWDTHGLAVEIEVEKSLGLSGKKDIEAIVPGDRRASIEAFNRKCLDSVMTYEEKWRAMSERVGYWIDLDDAYFTYSNRYVESVWWSLAELHRKKLLSKASRFSRTARAAGPRCRRMRWRRTTKRRKTLRSGRSSGSCPGKKRKACWVRRKTCRVRGSWGGPQRRGPRSRTSRWR